MKAKVLDLKDTRCPLCNKPLASDEYVKARSQLEVEVKQRYEQDGKKRAEKYEEQIRKLEEQHKKEEKSNQVIHDEEVEKLKKSLESMHDKQIADMEKNYEKITKQNQKQFEELGRQQKQNYDTMIQVEKKRLKTYEREVKSAHKKDLEEKARQIRDMKKEQADLKREGQERLKKELGEKNREIQQMKKNQISFKKEIQSSVRNEFSERVFKLEDDLRQKETQIERANKDLEELKIAKTQPELKGEVGEQDLYATLTHTFTDDLFKRQKRGTSSGDLIQQIRTTTGFLDTLIVYDNKSAATVTKKDIEKAKKYKKIHGTNYVLIVARNLPKKSVPNGLLGNQDGVLLVNHSIVTEVARQIRTGIIEISKLTKSKEDQDAKQSKLYEYINSSEFSMILESFHRVNEDLFTLQSKEERDHETLWKTRKSLQDQLRRASNDLSSGIESITQREAILEMQ